MRKSIEELRKLNSKNLLRFYRAERKRYNVAISQYHWGFETCEYMWEHSDDEFYQKEKIRFNEWKDFLNLIKTELNTREHIS
jgi:hypothetical protein